MENLNIPKPTNLPTTFSVAFLSCIGFTILNFIFFTYQLKDFPSILNYSTILISFSSVISVVLLIYILKHFYNLYLKLNFVKSIKSDDFLYHKLMRDSIKDISHEIGLTSKETNTTLIQIKYRIDNLIYKYGVSIKKPDVQNYISHLELAKTKPLESISVSYKDELINIGFRIDGKHNIYTPNYFQPNNIGLITFLAGLLSFFICIATIFSLSILKPTLDIYELSPEFYSYFSYIPSITVAFILLILFITNKTLVTLLSDSFDGEME